MKHAIALLIPALLAISASSALSADTAGTTTQPVLEKPEPEPTRFWTFVLTNEGPDTGWVLASAYPGLPDPDPDADGLEEGDEISLEEAARRGLRVKAD